MADPFEAEDAGFDEEHVPEELLHLHVALEEAKVTPVEFKEWADADHD